MSRHEQDESRADVRQLQGFPYAFVRDSSLSNCQPNRIGQSTERREAGIVQRHRFEEQLRLGAHGAVACAECRR